MSAGTLKRSSAPRPASRPGPAPHRVAAHRTALTGASLVRLLSRLLADEAAELREPRQQFAQRLSQWLGWADAISLFAALGPQAAAPQPSGAPAGPLPGAAQADADRVRAQLAQAMQEAPAEADDDAGYAPWRRHYQSRQQRMEQAIGPLRDRLRQQLAARPGPLARLAEVDAVMQQVLAPQEQRLLATVPGWLGKHFERLRQAGAAGFAQDMQAVLLAELDIRFQPVEGLLEALRTPP